MSIRGGAFGMSRGGAFIMSRGGARGWPGRLVVLVAGARNNTFSTGFADTWRLTKELEKISSQDTGGSGALDATSITGDNVGTNTWCVSNSRFRYMGGGWTIVTSNPYRVRIAGDYVFACGDRSAAPTGSVRSLWKVEKLTGTIVASLDHGPALNNAGTLDLAVCPTSGDVVFIARTSPVFPETYGVYRYDSVLGTEIYSYDFGSELVAQVFMPIAVDDEENAYVLGVAGAGLARVIKFAPNGARLWISSETNYLYTSTPDLCVMGGVVYATVANLTPRQRIWKLDADTGSTVGEIDLGAGLVAPQSSQAIAAAPGGKLYVGTLRGTAWGGSAGQNASVFRIDTDGNILNHYDTGSSVREIAIVEGVTV